MLIIQTVTLNKNFLRSRKYMTNKCSINLHNNRINNSIKDKNIITEY